MSYRWDSTFTQPYGWIQPIDHKGPVRAPKVGEDPPFKWLPRNETFGQDKLRADPDGELVQLTKRPRMASWMVSHCNTPSKRKQYVNELKKYIDVAIYGSCGEECGRG